MYALINFVKVLEYVGNIPIEKGKHMNQIKKDFIFCINVCHINNFNYMMTMENNRTKKIYQGL